MSSNNDTVTPSTPSTASEHLLGRVKWFNNKAGYGFITVTDGSRSGSDIFVHHSAINVDSQQYKYLVQGEYVEFDLVKTDSEKHEWQAYRVSGIRSGKLMCETRRDLKIARNEYKSAKPNDDVETKMPKQRVNTSELRDRKTSGPRVPGEGPRDGNKKEWTLVPGKSRDNTRPPRNQGPRIVRDSPADSSK